MGSGQLRTSWRRRLWIGWSLVALLIITIIVGSFAASKDKGIPAKGIGLDFVAFYRAGVLVDQGQANQLYDLKATGDFDRELVQREKLPLENKIGLFYNPPFFAWVFAPLVGLGYSAALGVWLGFGIVCFIAAAWLIARMVPPRVTPGSLSEGMGGMPVRQWKDWALVPALMCVSLPFIQTIMHGQNTFLSLLLAAGVVTMWRQGRGFATGAMAGLLVYKPQLAAVILAAVVVTLGWRAFLGAVASIGGLLLINVVTLPGSLQDYFRRLGPDFTWMLANHSYLWERHVTFRGFWQVILQNASPGAAAGLAPKLAILCAAPLGVWVAACVWRNRKSMERDRMIAAVMMASPLMMPYYVDYDLLLLALPAVLFAGEMMQRDAGSPMNARDNWVTRLWVGLFLLMLVNPGLTKTFHFNLCVPVLCMIAVLLISRAWGKEAVQRGNETAVVTSADRTPLSAAA